MLLTIIFARVNALFCVSPKNDLSHKRTAATGSPLLSRKGMVISRSTPLSPAIKNGTVGDGLFIRILARLAVFNWIFAGDDVRFALVIEHVNPATQGSRGLLCNDVVHLRTCAADTLARCKSISASQKKLTASDLVQNPTLPSLKLLSCNGGISNWPSNRQVIWLPLALHGERMPEFHW